MTASTAQKPREKEPCAKCGNKVYALHDGLCTDCHWTETWLKERQEKWPAADDEAREKWYEKFGVEGRWSGLDFKSFKREKQPKAFDVIKACSDNFSSIVLYSPGIYGVGKTHLVSVLANEIVNTKEAASFNDRNRCFRYNPCPVKFITENQMLSSIKQTYQKDAVENEDVIYKRLSAFDLLIIDDVGKVKPHDLSFLQGVYFRIIDDRYTQKKFIVITTNLDLKELEIFIGGASADRLREMCEKNFIKMAGESYRKNSGK